MKLLRYGTMVIGGTLLGTLVLTQGLGYGGARKRTLEQQRRHREMVESAPLPDRVIYEALFGLGEYFAQGRNGTHPDAAKPAPLAQRTSAAAR